MINGVSKGQDRTSMKIEGWLLMAIVAATLLPGCVTSLCLSEFDDFYPAYGGRHARADMVHGRVGSIFDPAPELEPQDFVPHAQGIWYDQADAVWQEPSHQTAAYQTTNQTAGPELTVPTNSKIHVTLGPPESVE